MANGESATSGKTFPVYDPFHGRIRNNRSGLPGRNADEVGPRRKGRTRTLRFGPGGPETTAAADAGDSLQTCGKKIARTPRHFANLNARNMANRLSKSRILISRTGRRTCCEYYGGWRTRLTRPCESGFAAQTRLSFTLRGKKMGVRGGPRHSVELYVW